MNLPIEFFLQKTEKNSIDSYTVLYRKGLIKVYTQHTEVKLLGICKHVSNKDYRETSRIYWKLRDN
jgi:hypothetical protein